MNRAKYIKKLLLAIAIACVGLAVIVLLANYGDSVFPESWSATTRIVIIIGIYIATFTSSFAVFVVMIYDMINNSKKAKLDKQAQQDALLLQQSQHEQSDDNQ